MGTYLTDTVAAALRVATKGCQQGTGASGGVNEHLLGPIAAEIVRAALASDDVRKKLAEEAIFLT